MKRDTSPFKLGLFVLLGLVLILGGMLWVGAVKIFQETKTYAAVFDFSVEGLQTGAPVKYLGVQTGHVAKVAIAPDDRWVEIRMEIDKGFKVDESVVVELSSEGIVGQSFLALRRLPGQRIEIPKLPFEVEHPLIPARPGGMARMKNRAGDILSEIEKADIPALVRQWRQTAQELSGAVAGGDIRQTIGNLKTASADLETILKGLSGTGQPKQWRGVFRDIVTTADNLRQSTADLSAQLEALPPEALADLTKRMEDMVATGEQALGSLEQQSDQTMAMLERSVLEVNRLLSEMEQLVRSLRQSPGQILEQRRSAEPFAR